MWQQHKKPNGITIKVSLSFQMTGKSCTFTAFLYVCMCETVFSLRSPSFFVSFREKKEEATVKIPETMTSTTQSKAKQISEKKCAILDCETHEVAHYFYAYHVWNWQHLNVLKSDVAFACASIFFCLSTNDWVFDALAPIFAPVTYPICPFSFCMLCMSTKMTAR